MRRSKKIFERGAALAETAISLPVILLLLMGSIEVMLASYYQVTLDAATFQHNRAVALGVPAGTIASNVDSPFSSIIALAPIAVSGTPAPAPNMLISGVMYGSSASGQRSGGVSVVLPQQSVVSESITAPMTTITSNAIEAVPMDVCPHFCMVGGGFGTNAALANRTPYFGSIDDNSPYVGGFGYMKTCGTDDKDASTSYNNTLAPLTAPTPWDTCPGPIIWRGLSFGPQLTPQNYEMQLPGTQPQPPGLVFAPAASATFFVSWCHRRFYAYIANQLESLGGATIPTTANLPTFLTTLFHGPDATGKMAPGAYIYAIRPSVGAAEGWDATNLFDPPSGGPFPYEGNENEGWGCWIY
jgi:hypothetical protein